MVCCPFHADRTPSMKLNEDYFYCFGCGASGDVIDLAARLFGLSSYDGGEEAGGGFRHRRAEAVHSHKATAREIAGGSRAALLPRAGGLPAHLAGLEENCAPQSPEDAIDPRYAEACHMLDRIGNMLDILISGTPNDRAEVVADLQKDERLMLMEERNRQIREESHMNES